jgi:hypothetical protein
MNIFLVIIFLAWSTWVGARICRYLKIQMGNWLGVLVLGFMVSELLSILLFWVAANLFGGGISYAFYSQVVITIVLLLLGKTCPLPKTTEGLNRTILVIIVVSSFILMAIYFVVFGDMVGAALNNQGVIYQDTIYHAGISKALLEFGFPIPDLQFQGNEIRYHIFTHVFVAKIAFLTSWPIYQIYMVFMPIMFAVLYSVAVVSFFHGSILPDGKFGKKILLILVIMAPMMIGVVGGARENLGFWWGPLTFSYSYGWQIVALMLLYDFLKSSDVLERRSISLPQLVSLSLILVLSTLIKASSLPLILGGFGFWAVARAVQLRRFEWKSIILVTMLIAIGLGTYIFFFSGIGASGGAPMQVNLSGFDASLWNIVLKKVGVVLPNLLKLIIWIGAIVSFRFILVKDWQNPRTQLFGGMFIVSLLFYFLYQNNPGYFLKPAIFIGNLIAIVVLLKHWQLFHLIAKTILVVLIAFSSYPLSLGQLNAVKKYEQKKREYFPLTTYRVELYQQLRELTNKEDVIFTPSCYGVKQDAHKITADNFYPAAISGRQFWVGGYRFGGIESFPEFPDRVKLVDNFSLDNLNQAQKLKELKIKFLLIETIGNSPTASSWVPNEEFNIDHYKLEFSNEAGAVLSVKGSN